jgi:hypothetical protein
LVSGALADDPEAAVAVVVADDVPNEISED